MMSERRGRKLLEPWMTAAEATGEPALRSFVTGLRADQDAVTNGLSLLSLRHHKGRCALWRDGPLLLRSTALLGNPCSKIRGI
jgi:hypothetical protein